MTWEGECVQCGELVTGFGQVPVPKPGEKPLCLLCLGLAGLLPEREPCEAGLREVA
jgi:hypothetical protein